MTYSFDRADFQRLTEAWNEFYPGKYAIDADILQLNSVDSPVFDWGTSQIVEQDGQIAGFVIVKRSPARLYTHPDQDQAHLSAIVFADPVVGVDLLASAKRTLRDRGATRLVFGQDSRHFFPGCPKECGKLAMFLELEGFVPQGEVWDLERDLADFAAPTGDARGESYAVLTDRDVQALERFLVQEFPGRWHYDVMHKVGHEGPQTVYGAWREGEFCGFALIQSATDTLPIGGAVWRRALGPAYGSLGPIGVSKAVRGQGMGLRLLMHALDELKRRGARQTLIDWTNLVDFYAKAGFTPARTYRSMTLDLET